jgi:hypothetical protein
MRLHTHAHGPKTHTLLPNHREENMLRSQGGDRLKVKLPKAARTIRVVCISGTYELHRELQIPGGDVLIHAGGFHILW